MNITSDVQTEDRIVFMDRMRVALVLMVIFLHASGAYTNVLGWTVQDPPKSFLMDVWVFFLDGFLMPLLYFIAGYFAYESQKKRTRGQFVLSKFRRIGLPFVAIALFLTPYITYVGVRSYVPDPPGFFNFWIFQMKSAVDFTPVLFSSIETANKHWMEYSYWHLWFVVVLLAFYVLYAGYDFLKEKFHSAPSVEENGKTISMPVALISAGVIMIVFYSLMNLVVMEWVWGKIGFLYLQPVRMPIYIVIFILGVYAGAGSWFSDTGVPGKTWIWGAASVLFSIALILCMFHVFGMWGKITPYAFSLLHSFVRVGVIISTLGFLVNVFHNLSGKKSLLDSMSGFSYEMYIIHLPIVIAVAKLFTMVAMPSLLKFVFVGVIATGISWTLGRYLIKTYSKTAAATIALVFVLLCFIYV